MTPEWASVIVASIGLVGVCVTAYLARGAKTAATTSSAHAAASSRHAEKAADNSKPVSNGFTKDVRDGMAEILLMATEARDMATQAVSLGEANRDAHTRHLEAHANGLAYDMRRIG